MRYDVCTPESTEKIGDIILDKSPKKGDSVRFRERDWRVKEIVWEQEANDTTNGVPSGLLCLEPHPRARKKREQKTEPTG